MGVGVGCQPLSSIMEEKLISPYISTGTISMQGGFKSSVSEEEEDDDVNLSAPLADVKDGKIKGNIGGEEKIIEQVELSWSKLN